ncbi:substrate-binding domain-containing protein [Novipirellula artificiosorum]|uniref:D-ribose-binding periplasmic protein n=1 Tax=Novipirellula artificiosorum TaxID=2528016 RepID=A0A5C6DJ06_9BACT|nr:substrate-binding domain-containing protein [Novipirellula artificiosorum]TWU37373.1 D-ribose-binding periplasmic protein precursor [Novipirellula artificiosorum]
MHKHFLILIATAAVFWGSSLSMAEDPKPLRLIFITCSAEAKFFEPVKQGMKDASEKMGVSSDFIGTVGVDFPKQVEMVRQAVRDGYDGIALNLVDPEAFDKVVVEAIEAGVPVVGFNTDDHGTENARMSCVNQRLYEAGRRLAERLAPEIPDGAHVLMTMHDAGVSSLEDRLRGEQDVLKSKNVKWTVLISGNDSVEGAKKIADALRANPDIRIVLGTGQADTEAAGRAIADQFADSEYWSAGFDLSAKTLELIKQGKIRCTVDQQPYIQGFYPVVQLTQYLRYGIVPSDIDAGSSIIDESNVDQVMALTEAHYR